MFYFTRRRDEEIARELFLNLRRIGQPLGLVIDDPKRLPIARDSPDDFVNCIMSDIPREAQLAIVLLPTNQKGRYDAVKTAFVTERPVPSQCVVARYCVIVC